MVFLIVIVLNGPLCRPPGAFVLVVCGLVSGCVAPLGLGGGVCVHIFDLWVALRLCVHFVFLIVIVLNGPLCRPAGAFVLVLCGLVSGCVAPLGLGG